MQRTAYRSSTPSWEHLATLRRRGQRPIACVVVCDSGHRVAHWERLGFFAVMLPQAQQCYLLAGLWALLDCERNEATMAKAQALAESHPKRLQIAWRGERFDVVIA